MSNRDLERFVIRTAVDVGFIYMILAYVLELPLPVQILGWTIK